MIKNIIFDWSGVIKDCVLDHLCVVNKIFKSFGIKEISLEELKENWEQPYMRFYNKYLPNLNIEQEVVAYKKAIAENPKAKSYPGITDLVKKFKQTKRKIVIISSDDPETILPEIENFKLKGIFNDVIVGIHDKSEAIEELIKKHNFKPKETIFIGDSNHEIEVGEKNGVITVAVTWGFSTENRLKTVNPDFIVRNLEELEKVILDN